MSNQGFVEAPITAQSDGTALTNTITATSILPVASKLLIPANSWFIGRAMRVRAAGRISTVVTTPGTLTLDLRVTDSAAVTVIAATSGAITLNTVAQTNAAWDLEWLLTCRAIGNAALTTLMHQGKFTSVAANTLNAAPVAVAMLPATAPAVGTGFNATLNNSLDLFATWSVANAANSIQVHQFAVEMLN